MTLQSDDVNIAVVALNNEHADISILCPSAPRIESAAEKFLFHFIFKAFCWH